MPSDPAKAPEPKRIWDAKNLRWIAEPAQVAEPACEHDAPMDADNRCSLCGAQFVYCPGCSEDGAVYHEAPACAAQPVSAPCPEISEDLREEYENAKKHCYCCLDAPRQRRYIERITRAESALRAAREEHEQWRVLINGHLVAAREERDAEREARKQEADKAFNAGWNEAIDAAAKYCNEDYRVNPSEMRLRLSKPVSGSPERLEGGK